MADPHAEQFFESLEESLAGGSFVRLTLAKYRGRDAVKNHTAEEGVRLVRELLGKEFGSGHLFTTARDLELEFNRRGESRFVTRPPTFTEPPRAEHDRRK